MSVRVSPAVLSWACKRGGRSRKELCAAFPKLENWERGEGMSISELKEFAKKNYAPIGHMFLEHPPEEKLPIEDFRTVGGKGVQEPSANLLDTIYLCQRRQDWYREYAESRQARPLSFVGSAVTQDSSKGVASSIRSKIELLHEDRRQCKSFQELRRLLIRKIEEHLGVLTMVSGIVGSNSRRKLDVQEFRGFALSDELAPLIFVNGADSASAQNFTLMHELAHLWLGKSALSSGISAHFSRREESWCNEVAAEILVPLHELKAKVENFRNSAISESMIKALAMEFKVSAMVILLRLHDLNKISKGQLRSSLDERSRVYEQSKAAGEISGQPAKKKSGGDTYRTGVTRVGRVFARAVIQETLEGRTLYRDAFDLLGYRDDSKFSKWQDRLGRI